jgi:hypothetical protein
MISFFLKLYGNPGAAIGLFALLVNLFDAIGQLLVLNRMLAWIACQTAVI